MFPLRSASCLFAIIGSAACLVFTGNSALASVNLDIEELIGGGGAAGDYNADGTVNAADYVVFRNNVGTMNVLPNDEIGGMIGMAHYQQWVGNFGEMGGAGDNTFAFENADLWDADTYDPVPAVGNETAPPGEDSIWFAVNNPNDIVLVLTDERTGENGSLRMGTFSYGGESGENDFNANFTFVLNNSVTLTGIEREDNGEPSGGGARPLRLGRENIDPIGTAAGGTTDDAPWAILLHKAGTLQYDASIVSPSAMRMDMSRDKPNSAGALYEISGDAVLNLGGAVRFGDRDATTDDGLRTTPGGIFRVRGSSATVNVEDYINESRLGLWDHDNDHQPTGVTRINLGKFVTEFVLDADGVSPIVVADELRLGRTEEIDENVEVGYAFLRVKLSEPTTAGSGEVGSGDELVLFQADRLNSLIDLGNPDSEIEQGRFFDPDREGLNSSGTTLLPHAGLWEGGTVLADYAGATYQWTINYFDSDDDGTIVDTVVLSNLQIDGTQGDLDGNGALGEEDRQALVDAIASPPTIHIASAQNLFDLNADETVNADDLALFDTHFPLDAATAVIPEPASGLLLMLTALAIAATRKTRR